MNIHEKSFSKPTASKKAAYIHLTQIGGRILPKYEDGQCKE
jgi:hypothetical protein